MFGTRSLFYGIMHNAFWYGLPHKGTAVYAAGRWLYPCCNFWMNEVIQRISPLSFCLGPLWHLPVVVSLPMSDPGSLVRSRGHRSCTPHFLLILLPGQNLWHRERCFPTGSDHGHLILLSPLLLHFSCCDCVEVTWSSVLLPMWQFTLLYCLNVLDV